MLLPIITSSVSRRLTDESISVREAAVSLVGSYVVLSPAVATTFHSSLLACLQDEGISVRKRAVKIFQSILISTPTYKGRTSACDILLQRAADPKEEDGVRDLIDNLFWHLWLRNGDEGAQTPDCANVEQDQDSPVTTTRRPLLSGEPGLVTPTPITSRNGGRLSQKRSDLAAEHMMEVVRSAGTTVHLEELLKKLLDTSADADKARKETERMKRQELDQSQCGKIVGSLFELLISIEEDRYARGVRIGRDLAATLRTIAVFAEVAPEFVFNNVDTILPYLKADNGVSMEEESFIVAAVCEIIYRLARALGDQVVDRLSSTTTARDLTQITYRFGPDAFGPALCAFSSLSRNNGSVFANKLLVLGRTFYSFLCTRAEVPDFSEIDVRIGTTTTFRKMCIVCALSLRYVVSTGEE
jgi:cohesin loading factor subunit SCC2